MTFVNPLAESEYEMAWGPWAGTHRPGQNWQSGSAWDLLHGSTPMPVRAPFAGRVTSAGGGGAGRFAGYKVGIQGEEMSCFLTHMSRLVVSIDRAVTAGQIVGYTGQANGVYHLHIALGGPSYHDGRDANGRDPAPYLRASADLLAPRGPKGYPLYRGHAIGAAPRPTPPSGATLRLALHDGAHAKRWAGWEEAGGALAWIARHGLRPRTKVALAFRGSLWRYDPERDPRMVQVTNPGGANRHVKGDARYVARVARTLYRRYLA